MAQQELAEIENTEHISAQDGENINAKRGGAYGYDSSSGQWRRISVNASGELS